MSRVERTQKPGPEGKEGKTGPEGKEGKTGPEGKAGPKPVISHAFAVNGTLAAETVPGLTVFLEGAEEKELLAVDLRLEEGTSCEAELLYNGAKVAITKVSKGTPVRVAAVKALANEAYFDLVLSSLVGTPKKLSYTFHVRQVK